MAEAHSTPTSDVQRAGDREDSLRLIELWRILVERRRAVLGCLAATVAITMLFTMLRTPQYRATATIQIERQAAEVVTFEDVVGVDPMGYHAFHETQYKILQSHAVLRRAAEHLDLVNHPAFVSRKGSPLSRGLEQARSSLGEPQASDDPLDRAVEFIEAGLTVARIHNSHLMTVSFLDRDPKVAADVANAIAEAYQQFNLENRSLTTKSASKSLTKEILRQRKELETAERKLQGAMEEKKLLALSDTAGDIHERTLTDLNAELAEARGRRAVTEARYTAVVGAPAESLPEVLNSALIQRLRESHAELERRHAQMAKRFKSDWPELAQLEEQLERARSRLDHEIVTIAAQVREAARIDDEQDARAVENLEVQVAEAGIALQRAKSESIAVAGLRADIEQKREVLTALMARQRQTEASGHLVDTMNSNIWVVDPAEAPDSPAEPRKILSLVLSIQFGLFFGIGLAFLQHHLDNTIKSEADVARVAPGTPTLSHIPVFQALHVLEGGSDTSPQVPPTPDLASHDDPRSVFAEAFKNLRTSLLLASPDHAPRNIVVTSCEPGAGKSTVAMNLSTVLTQMGRRVLLVDSDLRKPRLHRSLELNNDVGLSSYLSGNAAITDVIRPTVVPELSVVTSGPSPPNPLELLDSPRIESLMTHARDNGFDHVVFDCPPTSLVSDALILGVKTDGTLLVLRASSTQRENLVQVATRLRQSRVRVIGAILNAVPDRGGYYYYRYRDDRGASKPGATPSVPRSSSGPKRRIVIVAGRSRRDGSS